MNSSRHTSLGRRIAASLGLDSGRASTSSSHRCVRCMEECSDVQMPYCQKCIRARRDEVLRIKAVHRLEPKISAADLMYRTGASAPVVTAYLRGGEDAALAARETMASCGGSPMHTRDIISAHHKRILADISSSRFSAAH